MKIMWIYLLLKDKYNFIHIKNDYNTKFFGRFAICFSFNVDICIILDDDIIPGINCFTPLNI